MKKVSNPAKLRAALLLAAHARLLRMMRQTPSTSGKIITQLKAGTAVTVISQSRSWVEVMYDSYHGYVSMQYLRFSSTVSDVPTYAPTRVPTITPSPATTAKPGDGENQAKTAVVNVSTKLNVRKQPSTSAAIVTQLKAGTHVIVRSQSNGWCQIEYGTYTGYVSSSYLNFRPTSTVTPATLEPTTYAPATVTPTTGYLATPYATLPTAPTPPPQVTGNEPELTDNPEQTFEPLATDDISVTTS